MGRLKEATFYLMPISIEEFAAVMGVLADQRKHPNWGKRRGLKLTSGTKYPHLMADQSPFGPVWTPLIRQLRQALGQWPRMAGEFRPRDYSDEDCLPHDWVPLEVRWTLPLEDKTGW
jgi:hypothetical protein